MLGKIVRRSLLKNKILVASIFILFTIAMMLLSVATLTFSGLQRNYDAFLETSNMEEFRLYGVVQLDQLYTDEFIDEVESENNIQLEEKRMYTYKEEGEPSIQVNRYVESDVINEQTITSGSLPVNEGEVFITDKYATKHDISVGDTLVIDGDDYTVSGIGYLPDYTMPFDMTTGGMPGVDFNPLYMNETSYDQSVTGDEVVYYSAEFNGTEEERKTLVKDLPSKYTYDMPVIDEKGNPQISSDGTLLTTEVRYFPVALDQDLNVTLSGFQTEIDSEKAFFTLLAQVIIILTIFLVIVLFDSIFKSQRREIGILKAEGIYNRELAVRFIFNLLLLLMVGAILGIVSGFYLSNVLSNLLLGLYSVPISESYPPDFKTNIIIVLAVIAVVISLVYLLAIRKNLRKKPLVLIKNINSEKNPTINIAKFTKRFSFKTKYTISIFVRNFFMTIMLSIGVLVSSFMLLFGTLMLSSIHDMTSDTYTKMFKYDYTVTYSAGYEAEYDKYSTISYTTDIVSMSNGYEVASETKLPLYGYDVNDNDLIDLYAPNGDEIPVEAYETGIVLSAGLASHYDLEIRDSVVIKNPVDVEQEIEIPITAIVDDGFGMKAYMDISYMQTLFDLESDFSNGLVYVGDRTDEIKSKDPKAQITSAVDLSSSMNENIKVMYTMVGMITLMSSTIAFITMASISILVINNNRKTISVMKVLGYTTKEIRRMTTGVYKWIVILVYFGSIPLVDYLINALIANAMKEMDFTLSVNLDLKFAMLGFVVIFGIYFLSMRFAQRSIHKIKLSESLKTDE